MTDHVKPEVSILLPVHGDISFLSQTVDSVLEQTFIDFELIIINDRLSKCEKKVVMELISCDSRFRLIDSQGIGLVAALNTGLNASFGNFIARIDADDLMTHNRLEIQANYLKNNPEVAVVGTQMKFIDSQSFIVGKTSYPTSSDQVVRTLAFQNCVGHPSVMFRKQSVVSIGGYFPFFQGAEDFELWVRVSQNSKVINLEMYLTYYRLTPDQYSRTLGEKSQMLAEAIRYKNSYPNLFPSSILHSQITESELVTFLNFCREQVSRVDLPFVQLSKYLSNIQKYSGKLSLFYFTLLVLNLLKLCRLSPRMSFQILKYNLNTKFISFSARLSREV